MKAMLTGLMAMILISVSAQDTSKTVIDSSYYLHGRLINGRGKPPQAAAGDTVIQSNQFNYEYYMLRTSGSVKVITDYPNVFDDIQRVYPEKVKSYTVQNRQDRLGTYKRYTIYLKLDSYDHLKKYLSREQPHP